jgi:hypothetical protein
MPAVPGGGSQQATIAENISFMVSTGSGLRHARSCDLAAFGPATKARASAAIAGRDLISGLRLRATASINVSSLVERFL